MQDEVNQDYSEQNEVDGMKKGAAINVSSVYCLMQNRHN